MSCDACRLEVQRCYCDDVETDREIAALREQLAAVTAERDEARRREHVTDCVRRRQVAHLHDAHNALRLTGEMVDILSERSELLCRLAFETSASVDVLTEANVKLQKRASLWRRMAQRLFARMKFHKGAARVWLDAAQHRAEERDSIYLELCEARHDVAALDEQNRKLTERLRSERGVDGCQWCAMQRSFKDSGK